MKHLNEEEIILHYYGETDEPQPVEQHLDECDTCRAVYTSLQRVLNAMDAVPVPERRDQYETEVWNRLENRLPARRRAGWLTPPWRWPVAALGFASLLVAAFLAGRFYPRAAGPGKVAGDSGSERILTLAVGDYLERSQMVLIELANAEPPGGLDISFERERAENLVGENRLYRQTALRSGDAAMASVLDELERVLLDIAHAPSRMSPAELEDLRSRLQADGILFKIRVLGSNARSEEEPRGGKKL